MCVGAYLGMNMADNAYFLPNYEASATLCYTNTPGRTSMRAPGALQTCFATELVVERVAYELGLPVWVVQQRNFIRDGQAAVNSQVITNCTLPTVWDSAMRTSHFHARLQGVQRYNDAYLWRKRGISIVPVKYGVHWKGYNGGIRIGVRQGDGTVTVSHTGSEIGQGRVH